MGGVRGLRRKSDRSTHRTNNRDFLDDLENDNDTPLKSGPTPPIRSGSPVRHKSIVEDRRHWAPAAPLDPPRVPARDFSGRTARISHQPKKSLLVRRGPSGKSLQSKRPLWSRLEKAAPRFAEQARTIICFKRKARREVLHALKLKRSGSGVRKKRNRYSEVHC